MECFSQIESIGFQYLFFSNLFLYNLFFYTQFTVHARYVDKNQSFTGFQKYVGEIGHKKITGSPRFLRCSSQCSYLAHIIEHFFNPFMKEDIYETGFRELLSTWRTFFLCF